MSIWNKLFGHRKNRLITTVQHLHAKPTHNIHCPACGNQLVGEYDEFITAGRKGYRYSCCDHKTHSFFFRIYDEEGGAHILYGNVSMNFIRLSDAMRYIKLLPKDCYGMKFDDNGDEWVFSRSEEDKYGWNKKITLGEKE